jgi:hypothetical protein
MNLLLTINFYNKQRNNRESYSVMLHSMTIGQTRDCFSFFSTVWEASNGVEIDNGKLADRDTAGVRVRVILINDQGWGFKALGGDSSSGVVPAPVGLDTLKELLPGHRFEVVEELDLTSVVVGLHIGIKVGLFGRDFDVAGIPRLHPVGEGVLAGLWPSKFHTRIGLHDHLTGVDSRKPKGMQYEADHGSGVQLRDLVAVPKEDHTAFYIANRVLILGKVPELDAGSEIWDVCEVFDIGFELVEALEQGFDRPHVLALFPHFGRPCKLAMLPEDAIGCISRNRKSVRGNQPSTPHEWSQLSGRQNPLLDLFWRFASRTMRALSMVP